MELEEDENVLLDGGPLGYRKKLILTNKRLLVHKGKGFFNVTWKIENEIPLSKIEEATEDMDTFTSYSRLVLKMKNKEKMNFGFKLTDSQMLSSFGDTSTMNLKIKAITDKYVTAINHQINKKVEENPLKLLQIRFAKGEISKEEYEEMKQVLEGGKS